MTTKVGISVVAAAVVACSASTSANELHACDPRATTTSAANEVEYDLASDDGKRVVVFALSSPSATDGYGERFFYGSPPTLTEYALTNTGHGKDVCGDAFFDFNIDNQSAEAKLWGPSAATSCAQSHPHN